MVIFRSLCADQNGGHGSGMSRNGSVFGSLGNLTKHIVVLFLFLIRLNRCFQVCSHLVTDTGWGIFHCYVGLPEGRSHSELEPQY